MCKIKGIPGKFVDKTRRVYNNPKIAEQTLQDMLSEFIMGKDLVHPNIIEYKYFMRKYDQLTQNNEFHIIMELMEGQDMEDYLKEQGRPFMVDRVK